jgi:glycosyltransferase involved in cell wall biosynthesis
MYPWLALGCVAAWVTQDVVVLASVVTGGFIIASVTAAVMSVPLADRLGEAQSGRPSVITVGAFPPPVHGMSVVNANVSQQLVELGYEAARFDHSPGALSSETQRTVRRALHILYLVAKYALALGRAKPRFTYMSLSGGKGQLYDGLFLSIAALFRQQVYLHHHSFAYITRYALITRWVKLAATNRTHHIFLTESMRTGFENNYGQVGRSSVISNVAFVDIPDRVNPRPLLNKVVFFSNVSEDKGLGEFLATAALASQTPKAARLRFQIAGPVMPPLTEEKLRERIAELCNVEYLGPVYGEQKTAFLESSDVLLFPSRYVNEAEPLVLLEALAYGIPVIALRRGGVSEMLTEPFGVVIDEAESFPSEALGHLLGWAGDGDFADRARLARQYALDRQRAARRGLERLFRPADAAPDAGVPGA